MRRIYVAIATLTLTLAALVQTVGRRADDARDRLRDDRGSVSLEQIIWTVGLFLLAGAVVLVVKTVVDNHAASLN